MNMTEANVTEMQINGVTYVPKGTEQAAKPGKRAVIVLDRGWIVAGDVEDVGGRIKITRAVHVFRWESIGFDGVIKNPKDPKVTIKPFPNGFDCPSDAEIFRVPVGDTWGL
jgi:hypothetical protein